MTLLELLELVIQNKGLHITFFSEKDGLIGIRVSHDNGHIVHGSSSLVTTEGIYQAKFDIVGEEILELVNRVCHAKSGV